MRTTFVTQMAKEDWFRQWVVNLCALVQWWFVSLVSLDKAMPDAMGSTVGCLYSGSFVRGEVQW